MADGFLGLPTIKFNDTELIKESKSVIFHYLRGWVWEKWCWYTGRHTLIGSSKNENRLSKNRGLCKLEGHLSLIYSSFPPSLCLSFFSDTLPLSLYSREAQAEAKPKEEEEVSEPVSAVRQPGCILFFKGCGDKTTREDIKVYVMFLIYQNCQL